MAICQSVRPFPLEITVSASIAEHKVRLPLPKGLKIDEPGSKLSLFLFFGRRPVHRPPLFAPKGRRHVHGPQLGPWATPTLNHHDHTHTHFPHFSEAFRTPRAHARTAAGYLLLRITRTTDGKSSLIHTRNTIP